MKSQSVCKFVCSTVLWNLDTLWLYGFQTVQISQMCLKTKHTKVWINNFNCWASACLEQRQICHTLVSHLKKEGTLKPSDQWKSPGVSFSKSWKHFSFSFLIVKHYTVERRNPNIWISVLEILVPFSYGSVRTLS